MSIRIVLISWLSLVVLSNCTQNLDSNSSNNSHTEQIKFLDSVGVFKKVEELSVKGEITSNNIRLKFYSISRDNFFKALKANQNQVRYFDRNIKYKYPSAVERLSTQAVSFYFCQKKVYGRYSKTRQTK